MKKLLIVGTGGLARELTNWCSEKFEVIGYFSINKDEHAKFKLPGRLFTGELTPKATGAECALIAIGSPEAKKRYFSQLKESGFTFPSFVHFFERCLEERRSWRRNGYRSTMCDRSQHQTRPGDLRQFSSRYRSRCPNRRFRTNKSWRANRRFGNGWKFRYRSDPARQYSKRSLSETTR